MMKLAMENNDRACALCGRDTPLTFHHLIPRKLHRRKHFKKHYTREQLNAGIDICRPCHNGLHDLYDEMTLGKQFYTRALLTADPAIIKHVSWVRKQKKR